ncbi:MAG: class I SAM-dependent methyltransferase [Deltaproteobacteria bacterium]|nr:class I SAM-dependent methyltransferase [Deltaproteobacteria bacterium]
MLDKAVCYVNGWLQSFRHRLYISQTYLAWCSKKTNASWWHAYAIKHRPWRPHVCVPCEWITQLVPSSAYIFEVGCGSGANLIWLQQKGFQNLGGSDIAASAIEMCNLLASYYKTSINTVVDDALPPQISS